MTEEGNNPPNIWSFWLKWGVLAILALAILVPLVDVVLAAGLSVVWGQYIDSIREMTGLNEYLVALFSSLLFYPFYKGITWSLSIRAVNRKKGYATLGALLSIYYLGLYIGTRDQNFNPTTGASTRYWCKGPDMRDKPGIDPVYGCKLRPLTPEEIERRLSVKPVEPKLVRSTDELFDRATGEAKAWYTRGPKGRIEGYDQPGFTRTGEELQPMTREVVRELQQQEDADKAAADRNIREDEARRQLEADRIKDEEERWQAEVERRNAAAAEAFKAKQKETEALRASYNQAMRRARSETAFWDDMTARMERDGITFRTEITSALEETKSDMKRCTGFVERSDPGSLASCLAELNSSVTALNAAR